MRKLLLLLLLLLAGTARAQAPAPAPDTLLLITGDEVAARVLRISPLELRYLMPGRTDTLNLATTAVFLVRYANGTHELLHPVPENSAAETTTPLAGLSPEQRMRQGQQDAACGYTNREPFWGSVLATVYGGPILGVVGPALIAPHAIKPKHLGAPQPALLADPAYGLAYRQEAQRLKRRRAWGGYEAGIGIWTVLIMGIVAGL